jgi:hypothetical protein
MLSSSCQNEEEERWNYETKHKIQDEVLFVSVILISVHSTISVIIHDLFQPEWKIRLKSATGCTDLEWRAKKRCQRSLRRRSRRQSTACFDKTPGPACCPLAVLPKSTTFAAPSSTTSTPGVPWSGLPWPEEETMKRKYIELYGNCETQRWLILSGLTNSVQLLWVEIFKRARKDTDWNPSYTSLDYMSQGKIWARLRV